MQWCPMLLNLRNKQPSLRQRSKQSLPAPTGRRPHLGKSVSHWNNPPQPLTRSYARLQGKLIYYRTCLRFRLVTQFMSCIEKHQMFSFWICAICLQNRATWHPLSSHPMTHRKTLLFIAAYALWVFLRLVWAMWRSIICGVLICQPGS